MKDILPSKPSAASVPSLHSSNLPPSPSYTSLALSEGGVLNYASTLVQEPNSIDLLSQSDIIIAVMGPTGAGKSTFINKAAGIEETQVGHGLESCTQKVQIVHCLDTWQNRRVVLVDTPGFNDTNLSDLDILQSVANWLKVTYEKDIRLSGLLFFHRISDNRMGGSPLKYLEMFQNLCGPEALKNVVLVTTMWDEVEEEEGRQREAELSEKYWNTMLELDCRISRFLNTKESAWNIVSQFQKARCTVLLQRELVDLRLELAATSAGRTLFSSLIEFIKKLKEILAQIEAKLKQNQDPKNRIVVEQQKKATEQTLRDADVQRKRYSLFKRFSNSLGRRDPNTPANARRPLFSAKSSYRLAPDNRSNTASDNRSNTVPGSMTAPGECANASVPPTSPPTTECFSPPLSTDIDEVYDRRCTALQGTITALRLVKQMVGLAPVPGLQCLVGLVLNISEMIDDMFTVESGLIDLAQKAGSFMVILVEQVSINKFSDSDSMKSAIDGLTKEMNRIFDVVKKISSRGTTGRLLLSASDKAAIEECNRQMALACGMFGIHLAFISQKAIGRIEAKLNTALKIQMYNSMPPQSNQQVTSPQRAATK